MNKKTNKLCKKSIDIEAEFVGLPVKPKGKKEKKPDLTDYINDFLKNPITIDSIKYILLKMVWNNTDTFCKNCNIEIYQVTDKEFFIIMSDKKTHYKHQYFIDSIKLINLYNFSALANNMISSPLKNKVHDAIIEYLCELAKTSNEIIKSKKIN